MSNHGKRSKRRHGIKTEDIVRDRNEGLTIKQIAELYSCSESAVWSHIEKAKRLGMDIPSGQVGTGSHKGVATEEVARLFNAGRSFREMQQLLGIGAPSIYHHLAKAGLIERKHKARPYFCPVCAERELGTFGGRIVGKWDRFEFTCPNCGHEIRIQINRTTNARTFSQD